MLEVITQLIATFYLYTEEEQGCGEGWSTLAGQGDSSCWLPDAHILWRPTGLAWTCVRM